MTGFKVKARSRTCSTGGARALPGNLEGCREIIGTIVRKEKTVTIQEMTDIIIARIDKIDAAEKEPIALYVTNKDLYIKRVKTAAPDDKRVWSIPRTCIRFGFTPKQAWQLRDRLASLRKAGKI